MAANPAESEPTPLDYLRDVEKNQSSRNVATVFTGVFAVATTILASKADLSSDQGIIVGLSAFLTVLGANSIKEAHAEVLRYRSLMKNKMQKEAAEQENLKDPDERAFRVYSQSLDSAMM